MTECVITEIFYEEDVNIYICSWNKIEIRFFYFKRIFLFVLFGDTYKNKLFLLQKKEKKEFVF